MLDTHLLDDEHECVTDIEIKQEDVSEAEHDVETMVYRFPGKMHQVDNKNSVDYKVISSKSLKEAIKDGWHESPQSAIKKSKAK